MNIKGLGADKSGNVWLAAHSSEGIVVYNPTQNIFYNALNPGPYNTEILSVPYAVTMFEDSKGRIWIVSYSGLFLYDGSFHQFVNNSNLPTSISSNYIFDISISNNIQRSINCL